MNWMMRRSKVSHQRICCPRGDVSKLPALIAERKQLIPLGTMGRNVSAGEHPVVSIHCRANTFLLLHTYSNLSYPSYPHAQGACAQQDGRVRWWVASLGGMPALMLYSGGSVTSFSLPSNPRRNSYLSSSSPTQYACSA